MNESELRALVREAVSRHLGRTAAPPAAAPARPVPMPPAVPHASQGVYVHLVNTAGTCIIEPSVPCEHCNYCKTHGY